MKFSTLLAALTLSTSIMAQQTNETITIGGVTRTYIQKLPTGFDANSESLPVVFCLHGLGGNAQQMTNIGFNQMGDTARFITIYPQGLNNAFNQPSWANGTLLAPNADDEGLFNALIDRMILDYNADPTRIYSAGISMGGIMSYKLACALNNRIAAIASMSGTMSTSDINTCVPTYVTPVIHFHGDADGTVPYDSAALPSLSLVPETIEFWRSAHNCSMSYDSTRIANTANDGLTVDQFAYIGCTPNNSLELWRVNGGGHDYWYQPVNDFTESIEAWLFFTQWAHSNPAAASLSEIAETTWGFAPNPASDQISVESKQADAIVLHTLDGKFVLRQEIQPGQNTVTLNNTQKGMYLICMESNSAVTQRIVIE